MELTKPAGVFLQLLALAGYFGVFLALGTQSWVTAVVLFALATWMLVEGGKPARRKQST